MILTLAIQICRYGSGRKDEVRQYNREVVVLQDGSEPGDAYDNGTEW